MTLSLFAELLGHYPLVRRKQISPAVRLGFIKLSADSWTSEKSGTTVSQLSFEEKIADGFGRGNDFRRRGTT
jgi:hypothetical protein